MTKRLDFTNQFIPLNCFSNSILGGIPFGWRSSLSLGRENSSLHGLPSEGGWKTYQPHEIKDCKCANQIVDNDILIE